MPTAWDRSATTRSRSASRFDGSSIRHRTKFASVDVEYGLSDLIHCVHDEGTILDNGLVGGLAGKYDDVAWRSPSDAT